MAEPQPYEDSVLEYPGFKFDVYKVGEALYIIKDQVTSKVREVEHDLGIAIAECQALDARAGWEEFDLGHDD